MDEETDEERETVYETTNAVKLNGRDYRMADSFDPVKGRIFRLKQTGPNWDDGNAFSLRHVEFKGKRNKYRNGIFKQMLRESDNPHELNVILRSTDNDQSEFYRKRAKTIIRTLPDPSPSWLQISFVEAVFHVEAYRIRAPDLDDKSWSLRASDEENKDMKDWDVIECEEPDESSSELREDTAIVTCRSDSSYQFYRLVLESPREGLELIHFDMFGTYETQ